MSYRRDDYDAKLLIIGATLALCFAGTVLWMAGQGIVAAFNWLTG